MRKAFSQLHPVVELCYFVMVLGLGMFCTHPVCVGISLVCAGCCCRVLGVGGGKKLWLLPLVLLTVIINPLFSHEGATILTYLPGGNPLTLESMLYGLGSGLMLAGVVTWFALCSAVLTSDKFVYLFGRVIPALSLVLSMALGYIPKFLEQAGKISDAQKQLRLSEQGKNAGLKTVLRRFSILVTWSLENALDTADSMRSRGYGLRGRTSFSIYRWSSRDLAVLLWILAWGAYLLAGISRLYWTYYPRVTGLRMDAWTLSLFAAYAALCLTPAVFGLWEEHRWRCLQSGI